jgi:hypothetical protein
MAHRCTLVGYPGGFPWGFGQIIVRGVLGVVKKFRGSGGPLFSPFSCFIAF